MERQTKQQKQIFAVLKNCKCHPTLKELTELVASSYPAIGQATIYRTVKRLVEKGLVERLPAQGQIYRYDVNVDHYHFQCLRCGHLEDIYLDKGMVNELVSSLPDHDIQRTEILFSGLCQRCKEKDEKKM